MTPALEIGGRVIAALNAANIPHVLVGAFARNYYAEPRSTKDADIVVSIAPGGLKAFMAALGPDIFLDEQMSFETNTGTLRNVLAHRESGFTVELFYLSDDAHDQERFQRRRPTTFNGQRTSVLTAEDYVVTKLRWPRAKDLDDVRDVIAMQSEALDWKYIERWVALHKTKDKLQQAIARIPPKQK
ncbi:MAG TPA: hypothetical protein VFZ59_26500 [Verrucomicrobiae bacterium]|nr:hypothetical protein [Verrucomicrobiae bacterium]